MCVIPYVNFKIIQLNYEDLLILFLYINLVLTNDFQIYIV
jgi:hypothetical protein